MNNQLELFPTLPNPKAEADKLKRKWENGFQQRITIDYTKTSYEDAWWGRFNEG